MTVPELLQATGAYSIGTAGSIADHIAKLVDDYKYIQVDQRHTLALKPPGSRSIRITLCCHSARAFVWWECSSEQRTS